MGRLESMKIEGWVHDVVKSCDNDACKKCSLACLCDEDNGLEGMCYDFLSSDECFSLQIDDARREVVVDGDVYEATNSGSIKNRVCELCDVTEKLELCRLCQRLPLGWYYIKRNFDNK